MKQEMQTRYLANKKDSWTAFKGSIRSSKKRQHPEAKCAEELKTLGKFQQSAKLGS